MQSLERTLTLPWLAFFSCFHPWLVFAYCFLNAKLHPPLLQTKINVLNFFGLVNIGASTCDKKVPYKRLVFFSQFKQWLNNLNIPSNECPVIFVRFKKFTHWLQMKELENLKVFIFWKDLTVIPTIQRVQKIIISLVLNQH